MSLLAIFVALVFLHSLVSRRLERTVLTAPIVFTTAGMLVPLFLPELRDRLVEQEPFFIWRRSAWCCCCSPTPAAPICAC